MNIICKLGLHWYIDRWANWITFGPMGTRVRITGKIITCRFCGKEITY
jgi:hypothetical protein